MLQEHRGGEPTFPSVERPGRGAGSWPWVYCWSSLRWGCETQRAEALPVSGRVCATLNFWVALGFAGALGFGEPTHRGGASVGPEQYAGSREVSIVRGRALTRQERWAGLDCEQP